MNTIIVKTSKFRNLANAHINSHLHSTPAFIRIIPTDKCNLNCRYCWQKNDSLDEMSFSDFRLHLEKALTLKVGLITFLGGEPMLWGSLYDAISLCTKKNILTDLTTNATLLNSESIERLGKSGLDYLNISIDGVNISDISSKNFVFRNNLIEYLKFAKSKYRMHFRFNTVIFKNNFEDLKILIELSNSNNVQISLGFVVPPIDDRQLKNDSIYFKKGDKILLQEIVEYIIKKKKSGYPIIDPISYFENIFRFLDREVFWDCNYPTRYGWINVTPNGKIRSCTKKMDELDIKFQDLNTDKLIILRKTLREKVEKCNIDCYSNCAYDSYYYTHNKLQMLKKIMSRLKH